MGPFNLSLVTVGRLGLLSLNYLINKIAVPNSSFQGLDLRRQQNSHRGYSTWTSNPGKACLKNRSYDYVCSFIGILLFGFFQAHWPHALGWHGLPTLCSFLVCLQVPQSDRWGTYWTGGAQCCLLPSRVQESLK